VRKGTRKGNRKYTKITKGTKGTKLAKITKYTKGTKKGGSRLEESAGILFKEESFQIQGAIFEVYREVGPGFREAIYEECLDREMTARGIPFVRQAKIEIHYKEEKLNRHFRADFICYDTIVLEIKSCKALESVHRAQMLNYLKGAKKQLGILVNFCAYPKAEVERFVSRETFLEVI